MSTITITLPDETFDLLRRIAVHDGLSPEAMAARLVRDGLTRSESGSKPEFEEDLDYLLEKNAELYRRLAQ